MTYMVTCETWIDENGYAYSQFYVEKADYNRGEMEHGDYRFSIVGYYETRERALLIANQCSADRPGAGEVENER